MQITHTLTHKRNIVLHASAHMRTIVSTGTPPPHALASILFQYQYRCAVLKGARMLDVLRHRHYQRGNNNAFIQTGTWPIPVGRNNLDDARRRSRNFATRVRRLPAGKYTDNMCVYLIPGRADSIRGMCAGLLLHACILRCCFVPGCCCCLCCEEFK